MLDRSGKIWYRVRWEGYDEHGDTWQTLNDLKRVPKLIKKFHKENPKAPVPISLLQRHNAEEDEYFTREIALLQSWRTEDPFEVELINRDAKLPSRGTPESAGLDLCTTEDVTLHPGDRKLIPTGLRMKTPPRTYARIAPRSGLSLKGLDVGAGVVDRDYRGELKVLLINNSQGVANFQKGDRVAQLILEKVSYAQPTPVSQLDLTTRGSSGFGSTGL